MLYLSGSYGGKLHPGETNHGLNQYHEERVVKKSVIWCDSYLH